LQKVKKEMSKQPILKGKRCNIQKISIKLKSSLKITPIIMKSQTEETEEVEVLYQIMIGLLQLLEVRLNIVKYQ